MMPETLDCAQDLWIMARRGTLSGFLLPGNLSSETIPLYTHKHTYSPYTLYTPGGRSPGTSILRCYARSYLILTIAQRGGHIIFPIPMTRQLTLRDRKQLARTWRDREWQRWDSISCLPTPELGFLTREPFQGGLPRDICGLAWSGRASTLDQALTFV